MSAYLSQLVDDEIDKLEDEQLKNVLKLLREYAEIQAGTHNRIMKEKIEKLDKLQRKGG